MAFSKFIVSSYEVPLLRMTEDMDKKGDQKEEIEESHGGIGRGFDNSYFWGFAEKNFKVMISRNCYKQPDRDFHCFWSLFRLPSRSAWSSTQTAF
nr:hypothetical protein CFP56_10861 [Quercus suber]